MPIKAFIMPQTVPNQPTKGAVAPIVASRCVPRVIPLPARASILDRNPLLNSLSGQSFREARLVYRLIDENCDRAASRPSGLDPSCSIRMAFGVPQLVSCSARRPFCPDKLQALRQPDRPGHN